jgi:hypothetical protein
LAGLFAGQKNLAKSQSTLSLHSQNADCVAALAVTGVQRGIVGEFSSPDSYRDGGFSSRGTSDRKTRSRRAKRMRDSDAVPDEENSKILGSLAQLAVVFHREERVIEKQGPEERSECGIQMLFPTKKNSQTMGV